MKHIELDKLGAKSDKCLFVGYQKETRDITSTTQHNKRCLVRKCNFLREIASHIESSGSIS